MVQRVGTLTAGGLASGLFGPECLQAREVSQPRLLQLLTAAMSQPALVDVGAGAKCPFDTSPAPAHECLGECRRAGLMEVRAWSCR